MFPLRQLIHLFRKYLNPLNPSNYFSQLNNGQYGLLLFSTGIPGLFPGLDTATEGHRILISHGNVFGCLTGSAGLFGSGAIEDNFLVLGQRGKFGFEFIEGNCPLELHLLKLRVVLVCANKQDSYRFQPLINLFRTHTFWLCHSFPPPCLTPPFPSMDCVITIIFVTLNHALNSFHGSFQGLVAH